MEPHFQVGHNKEIFVKSADGERAAKNHCTWPANQIALLEQTTSNHPSAGNGPFLFKAGPGIDRIRALVNNSPRRGYQTDRPVCLKYCCHPRECIARTKEIVSMQPLYEFAARQRETSVAIFHHAAIDRGDINSYPRIFSRIALRDLQRVIARAIICDN